MTTPGKILVGIAVALALLLAVSVASSAVSAYVVKRGSDEIREQGDRYVQEYLEEIGTP
jgi:cell division protein FtsL